MSVKLGINGFGRIGRLCLRAILERDLDDIEVVAINDLTDAQTLATLFKYDSAHGPFPADVRAEDDHLVVGEKQFRVLSESNPADLPWGDLDCDVVIESTGVFRTREKAGLHLEGGAEKVVISAPARSEVDATVVMGVNDHELSGDEKIISNASCTTNCLAPMVKVLDDAFGLDRGFMTTVHAYTSNQNIQDGPHKDLRRARAAAQSIIPTTTGAAKAVGLVLPHLAGKLNGMAMRVPVINGSITDLTAVVNAAPSAEEVNEAFQSASTSEAMQGILTYNEDPVVSADIIHNAASCIFDVPSTMTDGNLVKIVGWYDNEWGYANRTVDIAARIAQKALA